ncbi:MAG TPA: hypothetical protein PKN80_08200, partial [bacterium]|nr:hypothetical protein [bacterium]
MNELIFAPVPVPGFAYGAWAAVGLGLMLAVCFAVGFLSRKKAATFEHFLVGHRDIGPVMTGLALGATWLSGWATLGMMGVTYQVGWSGMWFAGMWSLIGVIPCI